MVAVLLFATGADTDQLATKLRAAAEQLDDHHQPGVLSGAGWWADVHETTTEATEEPICHDR